MARILLVDDDNPFRTMLRLTLVKMGHGVMEACDGREAIALLRAEPPELVITDIVMPEKEGMETIVEMRRMQPGLKIIAMSGGGRVNAKNYLYIAKSLGADCVLEKPFPNEELVRTLDSLLARRLMRGRRNRTARAFFKYTNRRQRHRGRGWLRWPGRGSGRPAGGIPGCGRSRRREP